MTTAQPGPAPARRGSLVRGPLASTALLGALAAGLGGLLGGAPAAAGAGIGAVMVCGFFAVGAVILGVVAMVAPGASLMVALLTYTLKVVLIGVVFVGLNRSGALEQSVDPRWLAGTVIAGTLTWMVAQIIAAGRLRQPLYDLGEGGQEASVR